MAEGHGGDPAQAFDDLRAEVSVLRRAIEAMPAGMRESRSPDYSEDLGIIGKGLDEIGAQLDAIMKSPAIRRTAEEHGHAIAQAGAGAVREAARRMDHAILEIEGHRGQLAAMTGQVSQIIAAVRTEREQTRWLCWIAALGVMLGLVLSLPIARNLPFGLNTRVAAFVMKGDRWNAGIELMQAHNSAAWTRMNDDAQLVSDNRQTVDACRAAAARTGSTQRCTVTVTSPPRSQDQ
jgi:hypothetical protein